MSVIRIADKKDVWLEDADTGQKSKVLGYVLEADDGMIRITQREDDLFATEDIEKFVVALRRELAS